MEVSFFPFIGFCIDLIKNMALKKNTNQIQYFQSWDYFKFSAEKLQCVFSVVSRVLVAFSFPDHSVSINKCTQNDQL